MIAERFVTQLRQPLVMVLLLFGILISPHTLWAIWPPIADFLLPTVQPYGFNPSPERIPNLIGENGLA